MLLKAIAARPDLAGALWRSEPLRLTETGALKPPSQRIAASWKSIRSTTAMAGPPACW